MWLPAQCSFAVYAQNGNLFSYQMPIGGTDTGRNLHGSSSPQQVNSHAPLTSKWSAGTRYPILQSLARLLLLQQLAAFYV